MVKERIRRIQDQETRDQLLEAYQVIYGMDIGDSAKSRLIDLVDETVERHESITESQESTLEALERMNAAQEKQSEGAKETKSLLAGLVKHITVLKALLTKGKRIDA